MPKKLELAHTGSTPHTLSFSAISFARIAVLKLGSSIIIQRVVPTVPSLDAKERFC